MAHSSLPYDVLIVGAGPVGLATAIGLWERGVKHLLVIDQAQNFRPVGQIVDLLPNGLKALRAIAPAAYDVIVNSSLTAHPPEKPESKRYWIRKNLQGDIIQQTSLSFHDWQENYGEGRVSTPWFTLQTHLRNLLEPNLIRTHHRCFNCTQTPEAVTVDCHTDRKILSNPFAHWENESFTSASPESEVISSPPAIALRAKLVVAADGINSTIRQILYQNSVLEPWAKPQYSGWSAMGCLAINTVPAAIMDRLQKDYFQDQTIISLQNNQLDSSHLDQESPRLILINKGDAGLGYLLHIPVSLAAIQNQSPQDVLNVAIALLEKAEFPTLFTDLLRLTPLEQFFSRAYYLHAANPCDHFPIWSQGRVVLAGDAAHGMPPFSAQGTNQGFEDATYLVTAIAELVKRDQLDDLAAIQEQFQAYENHRRPFMVEMQKAALENHRWTATEWDAYNRYVYGR